MSGTTPLPAGVKQASHTVAAALQDKAKCSARAHRSGHICIARPGNLDFLAELQIPSRARASRGGLSSSQVRLKGESARAGYTPFASKLGSRAAQGGDEMLRNAFLHGVASLKKNNFCAITHRVSFPSS